MAHYIFGSIQNPFNVINPSRGYGGVATGLPAFIGNVINLLLIAAGLFALFNLVSAGISFISGGGDPKQIEGAKNKILVSLIGLVIIAASFILIRIISYLLFGSTTTILRPNITGPGTP